MSMNLDWIIGFLEGEGCFTQTGGSGSRKKLHYPIITIVQKERYILEQVRNFLGFGAIYMHGCSKNHVPKSGDGTTYRLDIQNKANLLKFISLIDGKLLSESKRTQYETWKARWMPHLLAKPCFTNWDEATRLSQKQKLSVLARQRQRDKNGRMLPCRVDREVAM